jgi:type I restriction enzyme S subunit
MARRLKVLLETNEQLAKENRWDLDYHLPPELIRRYPEDRMVTVATLADVSKAKRDPTIHSEETFRYVDISSVDPVAGTIRGSSEIPGQEAPSRARMAIQAFDVIVSTVRPTRGAVAVVPVDLHGEICSTGFCVLRCKKGVNPYFLHHVLRLASTAEQFRKFSTGSSYPAILPSDVLMTVVPSGSGEQQDRLAEFIMDAAQKRDAAIESATEEFLVRVGKVDQALMGQGTPPEPSEAVENVTTAAIERVLAELRLEDEGEVD